MPRILVADDNSNIQKMVALALKDEGFEVISVGNGEAAVRKLPEVFPDLVLADIFMPVRSGYEVCEYIKRDSQYAHIPVVLLVGAFDPLDENEAQRVQADGVLKKPFVPPDPLINMVKALIAKSASERPVPVAVAVSAEAHAAPPDAVADQPEPEVSEFSDTSPEEFAPPEPAMNLEAQDNPLAFGSLLETPAEEMAPPVREPDLPSSAQSATEDDSALTALRDPSLGEPAFWNPPEETEDPADTDVTEEHPWNEIAPPARHDDAAPIEPLETETQACDSAAEISEDVPEVDAVEAPGPEPEPLDQPAASSDSPAAGETFSLPPELVDSASASDIGTAWQLPQEPSDQRLDEPVPEHASDSGRPSTVEESASTAVPSPSCLSADAFTESESAVTEPKTSEVESSAAEPHPELDWTPEPLPSDDEIPPDDHDQLPAVPPETEEIAGEDVVSPYAAMPPHEIAGPETRDAVPEPDPESESEPVHAGPVAPASAAVSASRNPELVDAVVARVLERMQPQVIEVVTREILRPVVEALVRRELDDNKRKKP